MKVYARIGTSMQTVVNDDVRYTPAPDEILMQSERTQEGFVAYPDGTWGEDVQGKIDELDRQYEEDKNTLLGYFSEADVRNDDELKGELREEFQELNETYDMEREELMEAMSNSVLNQEPAEEEAPAEG